MPREAAASGTSINASLACHGNPWQHQTGTPCVAVHSALTVQGRRRYGLLRVVGRKPWVLVESQPAHRPNRYQLSHYIVRSLFSFRAGVGVSVGVGLTLLEYCLSHLLRGTQRQRYYTTRYTPVPPLAVDGVKKRRHLFLVLRLGFSPATARFSCAASHPRRVFPPG